MGPTALDQSLGILRCPATGRALSMLSLEELEEANQRIGAGVLLHRDGTPAQRPLAQTLGTEGRSEICRIEESIIWLLADLGLVKADAVRRSAITAERKVVQSFYDSYGWEKNASGLFNDTAEFTDTRSVAGEYQHLCNERIGRELSSGTFLLDVASGAGRYGQYPMFVIDKPL